MNPARTGQILRRAGHLVEAAALLGILMVSRGKVEFWERNRIDPSIALPSVFILCAILWFAGTVMMRKARREAGGG
jgi:transcriptional regulator of nitric oxide reductase